MNIRITTDSKVAAEFLAGKILNQLNKGKKVLWLVPGGSAITVAVEAAEIISKHPHTNLTITLTDERYGPVGHKDSNWRELIEKGFDLPGAKLLPVLNGESQSVTTENFNTIIERAISEADYKIGLFGIGKDGHTAGILPESEAVRVENWAVSYQAQPFVRITMTPKAIERLDEAVVWAQGEEKWKVIENFSEDISVNKMPAQILKKVPVLTIFKN